MTRRFVSRTFTSLHNRNFRLFFIGQVVSISGTWMHGIALSWLVLELTGSGSMLGLVTALQFLPMLLGGPWAGVVVDRVDKRRLLIATQSTAAVLALVLGVITLTGLVELWMVLGLSFAFGCVVALDNPTRQSFIHDMVGAADLPNAVTLNSVVVNAARVIGPGIAGLLIATVGTAVCFLINAGSYAAVIAALVAMRPSELHVGDTSVTRPKLREGLRYIWGTRELRIPLIVMAVVGTLAYEFQVVLPLVARFTFNGDARTLGLLSGAMGVGAVVGGLATAGRKAPSDASLVGATLVFGALILAVAIAPTLPVALALLVATGAASIRFIATVNASLQLRAAPEMRGRVMALWGVAFLGTTPIGGPIVGWIAQTTNPRWALAAGGTAALAAGLYALKSFGLRRAPQSGPVVADAAALAAAAAGTGQSVRMPTLRDRLHAMDVVRRRRTAAATPVAKRAQRRRRNRRSRSIR